MADKNLVARVTGLASQALSDPVSKAARGKAFDAAKGVTGAAVTALRNRGAGESADSAAQSAAGATETPEASLSTAQPVGAPAEDTLDSARSDDDESTDSSADSSLGNPLDSSPDSSPDTASSDAGPASGGAAGDANGAPDVDLLPYPQLEEPIPVVEDALAAEAENGPPVGGHATEPHASSRDEGHGDAQLQRAEQDEIAEEVAEALPGGDLDLETPVGTTGADVGYNPATAEADLQQPGTAPGIDPGLTSTIRKEEDRGRAAAGGPDSVNG